MLTASTFSPLSQKFFHPEIFFSKIFLEDEFFISEKSKLFPIKTLSQKFRNVVQKNPEHNPEHNPENSKLFP